MDEHKSACKKNQQKLKFIQAPLKHKQIRIYVLLQQDTVYDIIHPSVINVGI